MLGSAWWFLEVVLHLYFGQRKETVFLTVLRQVPLPQSLTSMDGQGEIARKAMTFLAAVGQNESL